jgi:hypothetical protein
VHAVNDPTRFSDYGRSRKVWPTDYTQAERAYVNTRAGEDRAQDTYRTCDDDGRCVRPVGHEGAHMDAQRHVWP